MAFMAVIVSCADLPRPSRPAAIRIRRSAYSSRLCPDPTETLIRPCVTTQRRARSNAAHQLKGDDTLKNSDCMPEIALQACRGVQSGANWKKPHAASPGGEFRQHCAGSNEGGLSSRRSPDATSCQMTETIVHSFAGEPPAQLLRCTMPRTGLQFRDRLRPESAIG